jgi:hypothetical protein
VNAERQTPLLIALGIGFSWLYVIAAVIIASVALADVLFLGGVGSYAVDGRPVPGSEFIQLAAPVVIGVCAVFGALALGLRRRRSWSRWAVLALWASIVGFGLAASEPRDRLRFAAVVLPFFAFVLWYFLKKPSVVAYFADSPPAAPSAPVRPVGVTLLALGLGWLSLAGFANAAFRSAGDPEGFPLVIGAGLYGISAAAAAVGLWSRARWAPRAFLAWAVCALALSIAFVLRTPSGAMLGGAPGAALFVLGLAAVLAALGRYVRRVCAPEP